MVGEQRSRCPSQAALYSDDAAVRRALYEGLYAEDAAGVEVMRRMLQSRYDRRSRTQCPVHIRQPGASHCVRASMLGWIWPGA